MAGKTSGGNNNAALPTGRLFDDNGPKRHQHYHLERWGWILLILTVEYLAWRPAIDVSNNRRSLLRQVGNIEEPWGVFKALGSHGADNSDHQLRSIKDHLVLLAGGLSLFAVISRGIRSLLGVTAQKLFRCAVGLGTVYFINGTSIIFVVSLVLLNYYAIQLHRLVPGKILFPAMWVAQVALLIVIDQYKSKNLFFELLGADAAWLEAFNPGLLRWTVLFNMNTLRMLSFNWDYYEAYYHGEKAREQSKSKHQASCIDCAVQRYEQQGGSSAAKEKESLLSESGAATGCYKLRSDYSHPVDRYNLLNYLTYMFYTPLYLAGPMSSFNAFMSHTDSPQTWMGPRKLAKYAFEVLRLYLSLELFIHFVHFNAIRNEMQQPMSSLYKDLTISFAATLSMVALPFLWLKFSFIWKFFRCLSLADGIDVPEDMSRCFSNVCTIADFWQSWHASFNIWLVRYMYIPMGGSKMKLLSIWPIFGFIAIWHDVELHLVTWAGVMCVTLVLEGLGIAFFSNAKMFGWMHKSYYFRCYRTIGAICSCTALVLANYIGFGGGTQAGGDDDSGSKTGGLAMGPLAPIICTPLIFTCGAAVGVILRENDRFRHKTLKSKFFGGAEKPQSGVAE